jgi:uncharacterized membrane protein YjjP (DUF1212 family)
MHEPPPAPLMRIEIAFVLKLAELLHRYGAPAHRLEGALSRVTASLALRGSFFASPTAIFAYFDGPEGQQTHLIRAEPGEVDLDALSRVDAVAREVATGARSAAEGLEELRRIRADPAPYGPWLTAFCFALVSTAAGRFFGGGGVELLATFLAGLAVGALAVGAGRFPALGRIFEAVAAVVVAAGAIAATRWLGPMAVDTVTLSALIILLPGLTLTVAMNELATGNLVSGMARVAGASVTFLKIGLGIALGYQLGALLVEGSFQAPPHALPEWTQLVALLVSPPCFAVLFRARRRDLGWLFLAGLIAFGGARCGAYLLGPALGVFLGALLVGIAANIFARWRRRPASVIMVPGIIFLVPGSFGLRSLSSFLGENALAGVQSAFTMVLVAMSLVGGLLVANALVEPRGDL